MQRRILHHEVTQKKVLNKIFVQFPDYFRSHVLAFSSNLDELNPGVSEWREDIGRVVKSSMVQVSAAAHSSYYKDHKKNELNSRKTHLDFGN